MTFTKVIHNGEPKYATIDVLDPIEAEIVEFGVDRKKIPDESRTPTGSENSSIQTLPETVPAHS